MLRLSAVLPVALLLVACWPGSFEGRELLQANDCVNNSNPLLWPGYTSFVNLSKSAGADFGCESKNLPCGSCYNYKNFCKPLASSYKWAYNVRPDSSGQLTPPVPCLFNRTSMKCNTNSPAGSRDHILVQPKQPCRGVEEWRTDNCGRESIWDAAWALLTSGALKGSKGMAINCAGRRSQHQMHVHVSDVDPAIKKWVVGPPALPVDSPTWSCANCTGGKMKLACKPAAAGTTSVKAKCWSVNPGDGPSRVQPFQTVYETYQKTDVLGSTCATTLVFSAKENVFCVVQANDRAAECMIVCGGEECQTKDKLYCP